MKSFRIFIGIPSFGIKLIADRGAWLRSRSGFYTRTGGARSPTASRTPSSGTGSRRGAGERRRAGTWAGHGHSAAIEGGSSETAQRTYFSLSSENDEVYSAISVEWWKLQHGARRSLSAGCVWDGSWQCRQQRCCCSVRARIATHLHVTEATAGATVAKRYAASSSSDMTNRRVFISASEPPDAAAGRCRSGGSAHGATGASSRRMQM